MAGDPAKRAAILNGWPTDDAAAPVAPSEPPAPDEDSESPLAAELAAKLDVIIARAPRLAAAGVRRVQVDDVTFELEPRIDPPAAGRGAPPKVDVPDPLDDETTYASGRVPRLRSVTEMIGDGDSE